ncbi:MAG TPA: hypothetical protein VJ083_08985 [Sedimentibacter sp.]|nr:hypothetical protein [Sedimentibacter sp.]
MTKITKICNMCSKEIEKLDLECNPFSLEHQFGYGSIYDTKTFKIYLCSDCSSKLTTYLIENCKISPIYERDYEGEY